MPVVRGFFFDLDGTLVDTYKADFLAYRDAIAEVTGVKITASQFAETHGQEMRQKLAAFEIDVSPDEIDQIAHQKSLKYRNYVDQTKSLELMVNLLQNISKANVTVLVTTAKKQNAQLVLDTHNLTNYFTHTVFGDDVTHHKPHPESYLLALKKSGLQPNEVVVFEDSDSGLAAATAAGLMVVKVPRP